MEFYDNYFKYFENSYPVNIEPINFYHTLREFTPGFIDLIIRELENRSENKQRLLIIKLKRDIKDRLQYADAKFEDLKKWLDKYETKYEDIISIRPKVQNELIRLLFSKPSKFKAKFEDGYNPDEWEIQGDFYNYWYGQSLLKVLVEIEDIEKQLGLNVNRESDSQTQRKHSLKTPPEAKKFHEYLKHDNPEKLAEEIKNQFKGKKGKTIALLISELTHRDSPLLRLYPRERASFYMAMSDYFGCSIGEPSGINKYLDQENKFNNDTLISEKKMMSVQVAGILVSL